MFAWPNRNAMTVYVVGNCTLDRLFHVPRFPKPGETLLASASMIDIGGKGANQAVVVRRCGVSTRLGAAVGHDPDATAIRERLEAEGLDMSDLLVAPTATDQSIIWVAPDGENMIVSSHSAAARLTPVAVMPLLARIARSDLLLMQGNLSLETTRHCLAVARGRSARTIVNPAPVQFDYAELWPLVDIAVLNEVEIAELGGGGPDEGGRRLLALGAGSIVATLGAEGAHLIRREATVNLSAPQVNAVDTTGAGDVFCGVLVAGLASGLEITMACRAAVQAATLSVTRPGTQSSFPTAAELAKILAEVTRST
jgi:ribokinase